MVFIGRIFLLLFLVSSFSSLAMDSDEPFPELHFRKVMPTREGLSEYWVLHQDLLKGPEERLKFLSLKDWTHFDEFYEKTIESQHTLSGEALHLNLNSLSGIYLFYLNNKKTEPIGFIKLGSKLEMGCIQETIAFKAESPKGIGQKALTLMKKWADQHHGKNLLFFVEKNEDDEVITYEFENNIFLHIIAATEFTNLNSLISHIRMGMEPLIHIEAAKNTGEIVKGVYLVYPPFKDDLYKEYWPKSYEEDVLPQKKLMVELKEILNRLASKQEDKRRIGLENLNQFVKLLPNLSEEK